RNLSGLPLILRLLFTVSTRQSSSLRDAFQLNFFICNSCSSYPG
ncbi:hypothetical protein HMPREF1608_00369, partial [Escherichia coli 908525]